MSKEASLGRCPFCQKGEFKKTDFGISYITKHPRVPRGTVKRKLDTIECDQCGIVIFKSPKD